MSKKFIALFFIMIFSSQIILAINDEARQAVEVLKSTNAAARRRAASKLARLRSRETVPALIEALEDEDFGVRTNVSDALGNLRDRRAVEPLIERLKDRNRGVRISVVLALGTIRDKRAVPSIIDVLEKDPKTGVKISAAQVLGWFGDKKAVKPLISALSEKDARIKEQAVRSLGELGAQEAAGPLADIAKNEKERKGLRIYAIEALGEIKTAESFKALKKLLKSKDMELAVIAAAAMGKHGKDKGLDIALEGINSENVAVRKQAVIAISYIGVKNKDVVEAIKKASKDSDPDVRNNAKFIAGALRIELEEKKEKEKKKEE